MPLYHSAKPPANVAPGGVWSIPTVAAGATVSVNPVGETGVNASVQLTGVMVLLLLAAIVVLSAKWPVG